MTQTDLNTTILPSLDSDYPLLPEQVEENRNNGHVLLRGSSQSLLASVQGLGRRLSGSRSRISRHSPRRIHAHRCRRDAPPAKR